MFTRAIVSSVVLLSLGCATTQDSGAKVEVRCTSVEECLSLAKEASAAKDTEQYLRHIRRACDYGHLRTCETYFAALGSFTTGADGLEVFEPAVPMQVAIEARDLAGATCRDPGNAQAGVGQICLAAGRLYAYLEPRAPEMAEKALKASCSRDRVSEACQSLKRLSAATQMLANKPVTGLPEALATTGGGDCSSCSQRCGELNRNCSNSSGADCFRAMACVCQCQLELGGCGKPEAALTQCVADNDSQARRLADKEPGRQKQQ